MKARVNDVMDQALETQRGQLITGGALALLAVAVFAVFTLVGLGFVTEEGESFVLQFAMAFVSVPVFGAIAFFFAGSGMGFPRGLRYGVAAYIVAGVIAVVFGVPGGIPGGVANAGPFWPFFVMVVLSCAAGFGPYTC